MKRINIVAKKKIKKPTKTKQNKTRRKQTNKINKQTFGGKSVETEMEKAREDREQHN